MLITNLSNQDYWFGPLHLAGGNGSQLTVDDTSATSLYLNDDGVADAINALYAISPALITVSGAATPFPRATGQPAMLHGDGSPEGIVYAGQGSLYLRRDNPAVYQKGSGIHLNTGWQVVSSSVSSTPVTTLPANPIVGQLVVLTDSLTAPTFNWTFVWAPAITTDSYKWACIGGADRRVSDSSHTYSYQSAVSGWADPTGTLTGAPKFSVPRAGLYNVRVTMRCQDVSGGGSHDVGLGLAKNSTTATTGCTAYESTVGNNAYVSLVAEDQINCISAGDVLGYLVTCGVNNLNFADVSFSIQPVRVT